MSITSEIERIKTNIANAYTELENKGATIPTDKNSNNLANTIATVTTGGGGETPTVTKGLVIKKYDENSFVTEIELKGFTIIPSRYMQSLCGNYGLFSKMKSFIVPEGVIEIGEYGLYQNAVWQNLILPQTLKTIGKYGCGGLTNLTSLELPESLETIGERCFTGIGVNRLDIPSKITSLYNYVLYTSTKLETVVIKGSSCNIGSNALANCSKLKALVLPNVTDTVGIQANSLSGTAIKNGTGYIYVPDNLVDTFKSATNWSTYASQIFPLSEWDGEL